MSQIRTSHSIPEAHNFVLCDRSSAAPEEINLDEGTDPQTLLEFDGGAYVVVLLNLRHRPEVMEALVSLFIIIIIISGRTSPPL